MAVNRGGVDRPPGRTKRIIIKIVVGLVALGVLGFLFMRSVRDARSAPYTVAPESLGPWFLALESGRGPDDPVLVLRPPLALVSGLFGQLFKRAMESMSSPESPGIPLLLGQELARAQIGHPELTTEALLAAARDAGLEATPPTPRCLAHRRNGREQIYFVIFDAPAFGRLRQRIGSLSNDGAAAGAPFDPDRLALILVLGMVESTADHWLPLRAVSAADCVAPIAIAPAS